MPPRRVNYEPIAPTYHTRYAVNPLRGVAHALRSLRRDTRARRVLEAGCGTGHWLRELEAEVAVVGLDLSPAMLARAQAESRHSALARGTAARLPFAAGSFDLVFSVNALHHFPAPQDFVSEARRVLRRGGALAVINMDPHGQRDGWYLYDYFAGAREADLARFPSCEAVSDWMERAGLRVESWSVVEHITAQFVGRAVLDDYFLRRDSTSQLVLLSDDAYADGRRRIEAAVAEAERDGRQITFDTDLALVMVTGRS